MNVNLNTFRFKNTNFLKCLSKQYARNLWFNKKPVNFGSYNIVRPGKVSPLRHVPPHIPKPSYCESGQPPVPPKLPEIKTPEQIDKMRLSCSLAGNILKQVGQTVKIGQTTDEIDAIVHDLTIKHGAYPSPLNYKSFPKSVCTSVNNVACHGIPDDRLLQDGDIINVDITVYLDGFHGDCSKTFLVGNVDEEGRKLVAASETCLMEAIAICEPGQYFSSIGALIQKRAKRLGFTVIPAFAGHGIGSYFHGPPDIFHFRNRYPGTMEAGMTFTIEPILSQGGKEVEILEDYWTAVTTDNSWTAQFEHTVLIVKDGVEVLTLPK